MSIFGVFKRRPPHRMLLEAEGLSSIEDPSEEQIRALVRGLRLGGTSFVSLTDETGSYVQVAGSRPWSLIERRSVSPLRHERAFQLTPTPKYSDGAKLRTGAGAISLQHDEWFLLKDAAEIMLAFFQRKPFPQHVQWRSMNDTLGLG